MLAPIRGRVRRLCSIAAPRSTRAQLLLCVVLGREQVAHSEAPVGPPAVRHPAMASTADA